MHEVERINGRELFLRARTRATTLVRNELASPNLFTTPCSSDVFIDEHTMIFTFSIILLTVFGSSRFHFLDC